MASYPLESMRVGGLSWFVDLTAADPFYILPTVTAATLFIIFKLGSEFGQFKIIKILIHSLE